ncbi:MAG TPA: YceI family protein [Rhodocyclaceae bacterium]|nr:YceI family protein [Rhodocyclaceae bacterium]
MSGSIDPPGLAGRAVLAGALAWILAACAPQPVVEAPSGRPAVPAEYPAVHYRQAEAAGARVLRVDPRRSLVAIEVGRAGSLARVGHDHVVSSRDVQGHVAESEGRADLWLPLDRMIVDEPELRAQAGFDRHPSPEAVEGTRRNMLEKVLDSARFPYALIHVTRPAPGAETMDVAITLHGTKRSFDVAVRTERLADGIAAEGSLSFNQSDFGIVPFSVLGGALQVRDRLDLRFRIVAVGG